MFRPNQKCRIQLASGKNDVHGQPTPGRYVTEGCSIVKIDVTNEKSSVRADSSASRGNAMESEAVSVILLTRTTQAKANDIVEVAGYKLRVMGRQPRYDVNGRLDHIEISATMWSPV